MPVKLKCGCEVKEDGTFVLGRHCKDSGCNECNAMKELHPFGKKRFEEGKVY
ncbi:MAG: hypothetical protein AABX28_03645 [Nanoarchaeota archaeon]